MVPIVKAIYDAIGTESPKVFILVVTCAFALFGLSLAFLVNQGYQNSLRKERQAAVIAKAGAEKFSATRPQLRILRWGPITNPARPQHMVQQGFYIKNFGMGESAIGVQVGFSIPSEVPDKWDNGEGSTPSISIDRDHEVFVPVWRKLSTVMVNRWDLEGMLRELYEYQPRQGNQEIPVTISYSGDGTRYITRQDLIYSPELKRIVGFGVPKQRLEPEASQ